MRVPCGSPALTHLEGCVPIIPVITYWSHYFTSCWCGSGRLAVCPPCERRSAEAEALKGAQQVEAVVLGFGFRMNDLGQLVGKWHFPANRPQVVCVFGALIRRIKNRRKRELKGWTCDQGYELPHTHTSSSCILNNRALYKAEWYTILHDSGL